MMLGFSNFLNKNVISEAIGRTGQDAADTAFRGHANEHLTHHLITQYTNHLEKHMNDGHDYETAHKKASEHMHSQQYDHNHFSQLPQLQNAAAHLGQNEMSAIHNDSKKTAEGIINHLKNNYDSAITNSKHTGGDIKSGDNADLIFETKNKQGLKDKAQAYLEHNVPSSSIGASLKYSKKTSSFIKVHSPTIGNMAKIIDDHHKKMHGESSGLVDRLSKISDEGLSAQREALAKHHERLSQYFKDMNDKKMSYEPIHDSNGNVIGANLSQAAVNHLRDKKDPAYKDMAAENRKMKNKMAEEFKTAVDKITEHPSTNPAHDDIKESLYRSMGNLQKNKSPTFIVSTERGKPQASVYDANDFITKDVEKNGVSGRNLYTGKSTFKVGALDFSMDSRPSTTANTLSAWPINGVLRTSKIKEMRGDAPVKPKVKTKKIPIEKSQDELPSGEIHGQQFRGPSE